MASTRLLLAADLHLGAAVAAPDPDVAPAAASARRDALMALAREAAARRVEAVLLAGDVFDSPRPPVSAELAWDGFCRDLARSGTRLLVTPGNHDPWQEGSFWAGWRAPEHVHVFGPEPAGIDLAGLWVAGAAHDSPHVERDLAAALPGPPPGLFGVGLVHADLPGGPAGDARPYAPTSLAVLREAGMGLWALGHWHQPRRIAEGPPVIMAGALQGAHLDEPGPHGAWLIEVESGAVRAEFLPLAPLAFWDAAWDDAAGLEDVPALAGRARRWLKDAGRAPGKTDCLRLTLSGPSPLWRELAGEAAADTAAALKESLGLAGLVLRTDGLLPPIDRNVLAGQPHLLGRLLELVDELRADPEALGGLEAELTGRLHPLLASLPVAERRELLAGFLAGAEALALRELWLPGEDGA